MKDLHQKLVSSLLSRHIAIFTTMELNEATLKSLDFKNIDKHAQDALLDRISAIFIGALEINPSNHHSNGYIVQLYTSDFFIFLFIRNVSRISVVNLYEEMK